MIKFPYFPCSDAGATAIDIVNIASSPGGVHPKTVPYRDAVDTEVPPLPPPRNL